MVAHATAAPLSAPTDDRRNKESSVSFCRQCGNQTPEQSQYCASCGSPIDAAPVAAPGAALTVLPSGDGGAPKGSGNGTLITVAVVIVIAIVAVVVVVIATRHKSSTPTQSATSGATAELAQAHNAGVRADLLNMATAEESFLTDNNTYTTSSDGLRNDGFKPENSVAQLVVGVDGAQGYCLVGSYGTSGVWYLYDSQAGEMAAETYDSSTGAEDGCSDAAISDYTAFSASESDDGSVTHTMKNAAIAEESYLTDYPSGYTSSVANLTSEGLLLLPGEELAVAANGTRSYCIIGSDDGGATWYLYDSLTGVIANTPSDSEDAAEASCSFSTDAWSPVSSG
jgi:hypothetical protein